MITSAQNPKIQLLRTLLGRRKDRLAAGQFITEGVRLVEEAWQAGLRPEMLFYSKDLNLRGQQIVEDYRHHEVVVEEVPPSLMDSLSQTETSQGLLAIFPMQSRPLPAHLNFVLIADNLRDPGNLGTILRSAAAANADAVLLTPGTTDAFAPKVLRAGMGAHFRLPILEMQWDAVLSLTRQRTTPPLKLFLAEAATPGSSCWDLDLRQPLALIIGGEAEGATAEARAAADHFISIPMPGSSESLNAAVAAGILIFEVVRQRSS
jgi:RNA methyltransferase, TrmH family